MTPEEAIDLIQAFDVASSNYMKAMNSPGGRGTIGAGKKLDRAAANCFRAMVGRKPTPEELQKITNW